MATLQINAALMGLLIAGGMLIPETFPILSPQINSYHKQRMGKLGVPLGAVIMVVYYIILFWLKYNSQGVLNPEKMI